MTHPPVLETARDSHSNVELKREIETMSRLTEKTWGEELEERFLSEGEASAWRMAVQHLLELRFQPLPDEILQRIATADLDCLKTAYASAFDALLTNQSLGAKKWSG